MPAEPLPLRMALEDSASSQGATQSAPPRDRRDLVSPRVGIIRALGPQIRGSDEPQPPFLYTATLSHFDFRQVDAQERLAAGKGRTQSEAQAAAIGEAVERYCAAHWDPKRVYTEKWTKIRPAALSPADCVLYSERQYARTRWPYRRFDEEAEVSWISGCELPHDRPIALPASLVYLVSPPPRIEDLFAPVSSNGLAAGPDLSSAVFSGLCELIERDALLLTWMNRLPALEIELRASGRYAPGIAEHYARFGVEVRAFRMHHDLPTSVIMAIAFDRDPKHPAAVVGMGCHLDPSIAVDKAVFELCQGKPSELRRFTDHPPAQRYKSYEDVKELDDHPAFLSVPERVHEFHFLWSRGERARARDLPNPSAGAVEKDLAVCVSALAERGHRVAYVDLTTRDIVPYQYRVARVIVSGLQPIHFGYGQERLGGRRLYELPVQLGLAPAVRTEDDLNPCPHPLA